MIWRAFLDNSQVDDIYKSANVVPIYKEGSKGEAKNYRPVPLTSYIIKVFEKIVRKKIIEYLIRTEKFNDSQHSFRSGHSTLSQLLVYFHRILKYLEGFDHMIFQNRTGRLSICWPIEM